MTNFNAIGAGKPLNVQQRPPGGAPTPAPAAVQARAQAQQQPAASGTPTDKKAAKTTPTPAELNNLVGQMQSKVSSISPELQFSVDKDSGKSIIKLTNRSTSEVVWQFPSEEALQVTRELDRFQKGLMLNRNA